jgi:SAM-dependent methyltransferase
VSLKSARVVVPIVLSITQPKSVVDVGCGVGAWLKAFEECGVQDYVGWDGDYLDRSQLMIPSDHFRSVDLSNPPSVGRTFDLAVCLEVGEHLPARSAPVLVDLLTRAAPCVLFSAAMPGQGGTFHVNERWPEYWRRLFTAKGYKRLDPFRPRLWTQGDVAPWYKTNLYLYCSPERIKADSTLSAEAEFADANPFELVMSDVLQPLTTVRGLMRALPKAVGQMISRLVGRTT